MVPKQKQFQATFYAAFASSFLEAMVMKHKSKILDIKDSIYRYLGLNSPEAKDFLNALDGSSINELDNGFANFYRYYSFLIWLLSLKELYRNKQERYIIDVIKTAVGNNKKDPYIAIFMFSDEYMMFTGYDSYRGSYVYWQKYNRRYPY